MYKAAVASIAKRTLPKAGHAMHARPLRALAATVAAILSLATAAQQLPRIDHQQGRAALIVDGAPYILLGAQVDNSSGWAERLSAVWPAAERMKLNTLEVPVYWEQMEP